METYFNNISHVEISSERLNKLKAIENLLDLCVNVKKNKKVAYEEANIDRIVQFVEEKGLHKNI